MSLFAVDGLVKNFGALRATDGVSLDVRPGEIHALIGPNGAGKSTLINQISGLIQPDAGRVLLDGIDLTPLPMHARVRLGLSRCFQITSVFRHSSVLDNLLLAVQAHTGSSLRLWGDRQRETALVDAAHALAQRVGLGHAPHRIAGTLPHGAQRQLDVALALAAAPKLLLLDEPMAGMGAEDSERMTELIGTLRRDMAILLIEHDMKAVFALADRISVLVYGRVLMTGGVDEVRGNRQVQAVYLGTEEEAPHDDDACPLLEARGLVAGYGASQVLFGIDFDIRPGQVVSLLGRNGMGKSTTIKTLIGALALKGGSVRFGGVATAGLRPDAIARMGIAIVPEGRQCFANLTVREHLLAFAANRNGQRDGWTLDRLYALFPRMREREKNLGNQLSGGEQQMLAIARALSTNPRLLILDEATEGLAPVIREDIWRCLAQLRAAGQTTLVVDKYVERLLGLADHHLVLERGQVVWQGDSPALDADRSVWARYLGV